MGLVCLEERIKECVLFASRDDIARGWLSVSHKESSHQGRDQPAPWSQTSNLQNCEKQILLFKPLSLWCFVMAAGAKTGATMELTFLSNIPNVFFTILCHFLDLSGSSGGKESVCNAGDPGSIPGSGRSPRQGNGNPLQYSCLKNPMDRGAWRATVHQVTKRRPRLSN